MPSLCELCRLKPYKVECVSCQCRTCKKCTESYLLHQHDAVPRCARCKVAYTPLYLRTHFSKSFLEQRLKPHVQEVCFARESSKLPFYHTLVDVESTARHFQTKIADLQRSIQAKADELTALQADLECTIQASCEATKTCAKTQPCPDTACRGYLNATKHCTLCDTTFPECTKGNAPPPCMFCHEPVCPPTENAADHERWCMFCSKYQTTEELAPLGSSVNAHLCHLYALYPHLRLGTPPQTQVINAAHAPAYDTFIQRCQSNHIMDDLLVERTFWITEQLRNHFHCFDVDPEEEWKGVAIEYLQHPPPKSTLAVWKKKVYQIDCKSRRCHAIRELIQVFITVACQQFEQLLNGGRLEQCKANLQALRAFFNQSMAVFQDSKYPVLHINTQYQLVDSHVGDATL